MVYSPTKFPYQLLNYEIMQLGLDRYKIHFNPPVMRTVTRNDGEEPDKIV